MTTSAMAIRDDLWIGMNSGLNLTPPHLVPQPLRFKDKEQRYNERRIDQENEQRETERIWKDLWSINLFLCPFHKFICM